MALVATLAALVGGGVALASPTGTTSHPTKAPVAKAPKSQKAPHRCHEGVRSSSFTSHDL